jgi:hypothetical protein
MTRKPAIALAVTVMALAMTSCAHVNHDSKNPSQDVQFRWIRIETPPSFQTLMFGCFGTTGLYLDQGDGNLSQIPDDGMCPISRVFDPAVQKKYGFVLVTRTNGQGAGTS